MQLICKGQGSSPTDDPRGFTSDRFFRHHDDNRHQHLYAAVFRITSLSKKIYWRVNDRLIDTNI